MIVFDPLKMTGVWQKYSLLMILLVIAWSEAKGICWWWWFSWWLLEVRPRIFVDDDDFLGDCFKWGQGGNVCSQTWDDCASNPFGSNPLWNCISHNIGAKCKRYLNTRFQHQETGKRGKMSSNPLRHLKRALSLKIEPIAALVLVWWPFSGLCVPIVDPKVKEDRVEALQNFFQVFWSITFYHFKYADHIYSTQDLTHHCGYHYLHLPSNTFQKHGNRSKNNWYAAKFFFCEFLNLVNVIGQVQDFFSPNQLLCLLSFGKVSHTLPAIYFPDLLRWLLPWGRVHDIRKWCRLLNNKNHHYHHQFRDNHLLMTSTMGRYILAINLTRFGEWCRKSLRSAPTPWPWFSQRFDICTGFETQWY